MTGLHFESLLATQLEALQLAFWSEDALRAKGFFKTPDAKLQVTETSLSTSCKLLDSFGPSMSKQRGAPE